MRPGTVTAIVRVMADTLQGQAETVWFTTTGVWLKTTADDEPWRFNGSAADLLAVLIYHDEINLSRAQFLVKPEWTIGDEQ